MNIIRFIQIVILTTSISGIFNNTLNITNAFVGIVILVISVFLANFIMNVILGIPKNVSIEKE